jgi:hypothetical protein
MTNDGTYYIFNLLISSCIDHQVELSQGEKSKTAHESIDFLPLILIHFELLIFLGNPFSRDLNIPLVSTNTNICYYSEADQHDI